MKKKMDAKLWKANIAFVPTASTHSATFTTKLSFHAFNSCKNINKHHWWSFQCCHQSSRKMMSKMMLKKVARARLFQVRRLARVGQRRLLVAPAGCPLRLRTCQLLFDPPSVDKFRAYCHSPRIINYVRMLRLPFIYLSFIFLFWCYFIVIFLSAFPIPILFCRSVFILFLYFCRDILLSFSKVYLFLFLLVVFLSFRKVYFFLFDEVLFFF